jgi:predicted permease
MTMRWLDTIPLRLRSLFRRRRVETELDEELRSHLERTIEQNIARGATPEEARRRALIEIGGAEQVKQECRETRGLNILQDVVRDACYGSRILRKNPGFTIVAVLTIALGLGATTAIFSVVDATLLRPLPYPEPGQLVSIEDDLRGVGARDVGMSEPEWQDLQHSDIFQYVSPTWYDENNLVGSAQPATVRLFIVAPDYFALLGVKAQLGRTFHPEDNRPGFTQEAVISDGLWKQRFGSDRHILGKSLRLDTDLYRIIGVMPTGFQAPGRIPEERNVEVWIATNFYGPPLPAHPPRNRRNLPEAIARLKPGLTIAAAQSRVDALVASLQKQYPTDYPAQGGWKVRLTPLKQSVVGNVRRSLFLLLGAVGLVLLIACVNVANLLLARASVRGHEMAIRQALGGERTRLMRQLLTESVLLSLLGGAAGLATLFCTRGFLVRLVPRSLPRLNDVSISWSVLLFALTASVIVGAIFGLAPALQAGRRLDLTRALKLEGRGATGSRQQARTRRALVVTEFALAFVLMIAASLLLHSFWDLLNVPLGFNPQNVMAVRTRLPYPNDTAIDKYRTASQEAPFLRELLRRGSTLPGVEEVAIGDPASIPLDEGQRNLNVIANGQFLLTFDGRDIQRDQPPAVERSRVTPDYFHLIGMPLLRGRLFNESDTDKTRQVAVINEAFARIYWPSENPLGKRFRRAQASSPWITVVGIIANARTESLAESDVPKIYQSLYQTGAKHLAIYLRGHLNTSEIPEEVREQVQSVDPTLPVFDPETLNDTVSASLSERRFSMEMVGLFALTALLLAGVGIYGVISYVVSERRHEIGIRLTLGAEPRTVLGLVLRQGMTLALAGAAAGLLASLVVSQFMASLLYGVKPIDLVSFSAVSTVFLVVALAACYVPARRAMRVDPIVALRSE